MQPVARLECTESARHLEKVLLKSRLLSVNYPVSRWRHVCIKGGHEILKSTSCLQLRCFIQLSSCHKMLYGTTRNEQQLIGESFSEELMTDASSGWERTGGSWVTTTRSGQLRDVVLTGQLRDVVLTGQLLRCPSWWCSGLQTTPTRALSGQSRYTASLGTCPV